MAYQTRGRETGPGVGRRAWHGVLAAAAAAAATWGLGAPAARAQEVAPPPPGPAITVAGDGTARAQPDVVTIRLGVDVNAQTPADALTQTRTAADRVVQRLRQGGVAEADVQTSGLNVYPIQAPTPSGPPDPTRVSGYHGTSSIVAQVQDVGQAGLLLDAALQAGATSVQGVSFGLRDDSALRRQALQLAIAAARPKAEAAAAAAGLTLGGIRTVVEQPPGGGPPPGPGGGLGAGPGGGEGIAPGQLSVATRVLVTYDAAR
jgi:uncharacterized protein YggE